MRVGATSGGESQCSESRSSFNGHLDQTKGSVVAHGVEEYLIVIDDYLIGAGADDPPE